VLEPRAPFAATKRLTRIPQKLSNYSIMRVYEVVKNKVVHHNNNIKLSMNL